MPQPAWFRLLWLLALAAALGIVRPAAANGSAFAPQAEVGGETLQLNGWGTRYRLIVPVYDAALYARAPVRTIDAFVAMPGAKRLLMVARRDIDADEMGRWLMKGVTEVNTREDLRQQLPSLAQLGAIFAARRQIRRGDSFGLDYLPLAGTRLSINGIGVGDPVRDPAFFPLVMRLWLGNHAVDPRLRAALLGSPLGTNELLAQMP